MFALCPAAAEAWFWALVVLAPTPAAAQRLRRAAVVALLREHRIRRLTADHVLASLQSTPLRVAPSTVKAASAHVALTDTTPRTRDCGALNSNQQGL